MKVVKILVEFVLPMDDVGYAIDELEAAMPSLGDDLEDNYVSEATYDILRAQQAEVDVL